MKALGCLHNKGADNFNVCVITRNGKITTAEHKKIAETAEESTYGYCVYIGGRWGKRVAHGQTGERFADTINRIGFENVQEQLLSDEILARKEEIVNAKVHLKGGATC